MNLYDELKNIVYTEENKSLSQMTTLRIGGNAKYVCYPENAVAFDTLMNFIHDRNLNYKIIGKGSDLLCSDDEYNGVIIKFDKFYNDIIFNDNEVTAQAGASLIALAVEAAKKGLSGLEFASGIPGTLGGSVFMNAGAYKASMSDVITEVMVYRDGKTCWIKKEDCDFRYRHSIFQEKLDWIILAVRLKLEHGDKEQIHSLMEDRRNRRMNSQPLNYPSCGSVFRNPDGYNAWQLIEGIGYRGKKNGGAMVSDKHCNFIVNANHASANDYLALIEDIQAKVKEKYDVELKTEVEKFNW